MSGSRSFALWLVLSTTTGCLSDEEEARSLFEPDSRLAAEAANRAGADDTIDGGASEELNVFHGSPAAMGALGLPDLSGSFRFLPPLGVDPTTRGEFDTEAYQALAVTVCRLSPSECAGPPLVTYVAGTGDAAIRLDERKEHFIVNWRPTDTGAEGGRRYRIAVSAAGLPLGAAEVEVASGDKGAPPGAVRPNQTLPVIFQVDANPVLRAWVLRAAGASASQTAARVADEFRLTAAPVAGILSTIGYSAAEVGLALRDAFGLGAGPVAGILLEVAATSGPSDTAAALSGAGFSASEIARALAETFGLAPDAVAGVLQDVGFGAVGIGAALVDAFSVDAGGVAQILRALGFEAVEVSSALRDVFSLDARMVVDPLTEAGFGDVEIGLALADVFSLDPPGVADALTAAGWTAPQLAHLLRDGFGLDLTGAIGVLDGSGFDLPTVAAAAQAAYDATDRDLVGSLLQTYAVSEVADWLQTARGTSEADAIALFADAAVPASAVGGWLVDTLHRSHQEASQALRLGGYGVDRVGEWLIDGVGFTEADAVVTLRLAGYAAAPVADWIEGGLGKSREVVVSLLRAAGFPAEDAMVWLEDRFSDMTDRIAAGIARGAGYGADAVVRGLEKVYGTGANGVAKVLNAVGLPIDEAADALEAVFGLGEQQIVQALAAGSYALGGIADWLENRGVDIGGAVVLFRAAGIGGDRVVELLAEKFGDVAEDPAGFVFDLMAAAGYGFTQFADGMVTQFGTGIRDWLVGAALEAGVGLPDSFALADVLDWGQDVGLLTLDRLASLAQQKGVPVARLVDWLTTKLPDQGDRLVANLIGTLEDAGYQVEAIAAGLTSFGLDTMTRGMHLAGWTATKAGAALEAAYGLGEATIVGLMDRGGYALGNVASWLQTAKGKTLGQIASIFSAAGIPAERVVDVLVDIYDQPVEFVFDVMAAAGYGFTQFADQMVARFGAGVGDWLIGAALEAGVGLPDTFALADIADWALDVGGVTMVALITKLEQKGVPAEEVIAWLTTRLPGQTQDALDEIARRLKQAGYDAGDIAAWVAEAGDVPVAMALRAANFGASAIADAISVVFGYGTTATARVLRAVGYAFGDAVDWIEARLSQGVPATIAAIVRVAKDAGFDIHDVTAVLRATRGVQSWIMAAAMRAAGYTTSTVAGVLHDVYELGARAGAQAMELAGYDYGQIAGQLFDEWAVQILEAAQILKDLGASFLEVVQVLSTVTQESHDVIISIIAHLFS